MKGERATPPRATLVVWHLAADESTWIAESSAAIAAALEGLLRAHASARLLLSGGTTPAPVYRALSARELDWERVVVGLVDDRDVGEDADGSNARLVRETFLRGAAEIAQFASFGLDGRSLDAATVEANRRWHEEDASGLAAAEHTVVVLGMGDDGHTASLFPGARNLDAAFASAEPYVVIDATGCPVAGAFTHRISLTPHALAASQRLLLIRGAQKRDVFERALAPGATVDMPIRAAIDTAASPLHVHWAA